MALRSTSSARRFRNAGFTSAVSNPPAGGSAFGTAAPLQRSIFSIAASICLVASGSAGAPSGVEYLMPLYSGGLCDAVKLIAPEVFSVRTAYAMAGVGAASGITIGVTPAPASTRAASATKLSPRKRGSRPTKPGSPGSGLLPGCTPVRLGQRLHIRGNSRRRQPDIGDGKLVRHNRPPSRSAKFDRCRHPFLHTRQKRWPQGPYCNTGPGSAKCLSVTACSHPRSKGPSPPGIDLS